ncbi:glycosyltransferase family 2 protein [Fibrella forsythiae]|uniref:Glycosyltransferase family 2 protein n=1 Tax=Fibrella forsythiae TaxID=2817061 RepID=A0ABS3JJU0_9BACT|nr:glycosyltransferase family 2 protein [Fibrella forsythiae]MBO0950255.1 glycosyltransferase family 2 protein [Fibrella forsythiae]
MSPAVPFISLVTINYNQAEMTRLFLESARGLTYPAFEVIVVDNASSPALSTQLDLNQYPFARLIRSEQNMGFTGGNNLGIDAAKGDYFFIVNNDTELEPNLLTELIKPFLENPQVGVVCPKIRFFDAPNLVQFAGYGPMNMFTGTAHLVGFNQPDGPQFDQPGTSPFAHGCAMLVSRAVVNRVGRFADRFFLYYEELDWSQRIRNAGFLIQYQPTATIWHKESASVGRESTIRTYYLTRNRILFIRRHGSLVQRWVFYGFFMVAVLPKHVASYVVKGRFAHASAFLKATFWNLQHGTASAV